MSQPTTAVTCPRCDAYQIILAALDTFECEGCGETIDCDANYCEECGRNLEDPDGLGPSEGCGTCMADHLLSMGDDFDA
jgi:predicted amidophosphoribosyltransferase